MFYYFLNQLFLFSDAYSSDCDAISSIFAQEFYGLGSEIFMCSSLDNREKNPTFFIIFFLEMIKCSLGSAMGHVHMFFDCFFVSISGRADVEHHHDVTSEIALDVDDIFWCKEMFATIVWRIEMYTLFCELYLDVVFSRRSSGHKVIGSFGLYGPLTFRLYRLF